MTRKRRGRVNYIFPYARMETRICSSNVSPAYRARNLASMRADFGNTRAGSRKSSRTRDFHATSHAIGPSRFLRAEVHTGAKCDRGDAWGRVTKREGSRSMNSEAPQFATRLCIMYTKRALLTVSFTKVSLTIIQTLTQL